MCQLHAFGAFVTSIATYRVPFIHLYNISNEGERMDLQRFIYEKNITK